MGQQVDYTDPIFPDITVEEFDALDGVHKFSRAYKKKKKRLLREYRKNMVGLCRHTSPRVAVATAAFLIVGIPIITTAATHGTFFDFIWGDLTKENIRSHEEWLVDEQDFPFRHVFPEREYVPVDPDKARELIGGYVSHEPVVKKLGDTTFTILSCVSDGNAAIMEFTLERAGGVHAFDYSKLDNEYHGATFSQDATFWFHFPACSENIYVDLERSTEDMLYCYDYMTMEPFAYDTEEKGIILEVCEYPCTRGELFAAGEDAFDSYMADTVTDDLIIPVPALVGTAAYANPDGGMAWVSPLAMKIDTDTGLGLEEENEILYDPQNIYYVSIGYKDKSDYIVVEHGLPGKHACETEIDNSSCISYDGQGNLILVFNRLVDIDTITSITVNGTTYTLKNE